MKYYYAIFKKTRVAVELEFPDLPGCVSFGKDWDEALVNAIDVLAAWLAHAEPQFISEPSSYKALEKLGDVLVPIPVDEQIMSSYQELKRFNVIFPSKILNRIDNFRKKTGLKRSTFLMKASEEYLEHHNEKRILANGK